MRTLIESTFRLGTIEHEAQNIADLTACLRPFQPHPITFNQSEKDAIIMGSNPVDAQNDLWGYQAAAILITIPDNQEKERSFAVGNGKLILIQQHVHNNTVFGLVCVHHPLVVVRWKHKISRILEHASERFVDVAWNNSGNNKSNALLIEFNVEGADAALVPVREPNDDNNIYEGRILPQSGKPRRDYVSMKMRGTLTVAKLSFVGAIVFGAVGLLSYLNTTPETAARWWSGCADRITTTLIFTFIIEVLNYRSELRRLEKKDIIDWTPETNKII